MDDSSAEAQTTMTMKEKKRGEKSGSSWFSYVMHTAFLLRQKSRGRNRSHNNNTTTTTTTTIDPPPPQWLQQTQRPATAATALRPRHSPDPPPLYPSRTRSRLRRLQPERKLKTSASAPAGMVQANPTPQRKPHLDQQDLTALPRLPEQAIPLRSSSAQKKSRPRTADRPRSGKDVSTASNPPKSTPTTKGVLPSRSNTSPSDSRSKRDLPGNRPSSPTSTNSARPPRTPRHQPLAPYDPFPLNPVYYTTTPNMAADPVASSSRQGTVAGNEGVVLPDGFIPGVSAYTDVETTVRPAVTQEVVKENTVEVTQDQITRDVHIDHYYTHVQPIKVVEILPARHFVIDEQTGEKVEIPAPEGWTMPASLQPHQPDTSGVVSETRHYVVDEQHPEGALESPPLAMAIRKKPSQEGSRRASSKAGSVTKWSPFPKVN